MLFQDVFVDLLVGHLLAVVPVGLYIVQLMVQALLGLLLWRLVSVAVLMDLLHMLVLYSILPKPLYLQQDACVVWLVEVVLMEFLVVLGHCVIMLVWDNVVHFILVGVYVLVSVIELLVIVVHIVLVVQEVVF